MEEQTMKYTKQKKCIRKTPTV